jgi:hypothetical protein
MFVGLRLLSYEDLCRQAISKSYPEGLCRPGHRAEEQRDRARVEKAFVALARARTADILGGKPNPENAPRDPLDEEPLKNIFTPIWSGPCFHEFLALGVPVRGSSSLLPGLSLVLLDGIGVAEDRLFGVVREALIEDEISDWLRRNADLSDIESLKATD